MKIEFADFLCCLQDIEIPWKNPCERPITILKLSFTILYLNLIWV